LIYPQADGICSPGLKGALYRSQVPVCEGAWRSKFPRPLEDIDGDEAELQLEPVTNPSFMLVEHLPPCARTLFAGSTGGRYCLTTLAPMRVLLRSLKDG
jgi:hypothetical protein